MLPILCWPAQCYPLRASSYWLPIMLLHCDAYMVIATLNWTYIDRPQFDLELHRLDVAWISVQNILKFGEKLKALISFLLALV